MDKHISEWVCYISGAALTLLYKAARTVYQARKKGRCAREILAEWFFDPTRENAGSWVGTIAGVWLIGSAYISKVGVPQMEWVTSLPVVDSVAFFLGYAAEMVVPNLAKWIVRRFPGGESA